MKKQTGAGAAKYELDTPCLVVDEGVLDENIRKMQVHAAKFGKKLRPHAKTHKCTAIAMKQVAAGAAGVCAAKVSEAEVLVREGVRGVLVTSPVATAHKIEKLCACAAADLKLTAVLDSAENARALDATAARHKIELSVLIDIDGGSGRTGAAPERALGLARVVAGLKNLSLRGIQCYAGDVQHIASFAERRDASLERMKKAAEVVRQLRAAGLPCEIFSGGGTGTFDIDCAVEELTELQVGSYAVMDAEYLAVGSSDGAPTFTAFKPALTLLTTVISANRPDFVTVDAGLKALYHHGATPAVVRPAGGGLSYDWFGDEHGKVSFKEPAAKPALGSVLELVVSHCDPTINLFDKIHVVRGDVVLGAWQVDLRGKGW